MYNFKKVYRCVWVKDIMEILFKDHHDGKFEYNFLFF